MNLGISQQHQNRRLILVAPSATNIPSGFRQTTVDDGQYTNVLSQVQRLRGAVYLEDGAIRPSELTADGRYDLPVDRRSWHVATLDDDGNVNGCSRYCLHSEDVNFAQLGVADSALAGCSQWGPLLRAAVHHEMAFAKAFQLGFSELGGWALQREHRCTTEALRIALATYGLAGLLGGAIGVSTATMRNCSASILQRLGGRRLEMAGNPLPSYNDPKYNCEMEILRFDSRRPADRYVHWIRAIQEHMLNALVICPRPKSEQAHGSRRIVLQSKLRRLRVSAA